MMHLRSVGALSGVTKGDNGAEGVPLNVRTPQLATQKMVNDIKWYFYLWFLEPLDCFNHG